MMPEVPSNARHGSGESRWKLATFFIAGLFLGYLIRDYRPSPSSEGKPSPAPEAASESKKSPTTGPYQSAVDEVRWEAPRSGGSIRAGTNVLYRNETLQFTVRTNAGGGIEIRSEEAGEKRP